MIHHSVRVNPCHFSFLSSSHCTKGNSGKLDNLPFGHTVFTENVFTPEWYWSVHLFLAYCTHISCCQHLGTSTDTREALLVQVQATHPLFLEKLLHQLFYHNSQITSTMTHDHILVEFGKNLANKYQKQMPYWAIQKQESIIKLFNKPYTYFLASCVRSVLHFPTRQCSYCCQKCLHLSAIQ